MVYHGKGYTLLMEYTLLVYIVIAYAVTLYGLYVCGIYGKKNRYNVCETVFVLCVSVVETTGCQGVMSLKCEIGSERLDMFYSYF